MREREKELGIEPDWELDAFMKASAARGKRRSIMTDYIMRILGLEVRPSLLLQRSLFYAAIRAKPPSCKRPACWLGAAVSFPAALTRGLFQRDPLKACQQHAIGVTRLADMRMRVPKLQQCLVHFM
jgi:hypothetical protein